MKVAITGSRGFIGTALVQKLRNYKIEIIEIDILLGYNLLDWESLLTIKKFDVLIHLAAKSYVPESFTNPSSFYTTNVIGTLNALELCKKYEARMIFTSSYVYGTPEYLPINENHPLVAFNPYAQSKLIGEDLCKAYHRDFDVPVIVFRPFNIYGKGQNDNFLIPSIIKQATSGKVMLKDPRPKRDFIYINDVVDAYLQAIYSDFSSVEFINLGSGVSTSIKEITQLIEEKFNKKVSIVFSGEKRKNEVLETRADISKANKLLHWKPKVSIEDGITNMLDL